ncbi:LOW QUALITY PROTEIN: hypothetical protein Cgig2_005089 [Carnegiea gigantea]|uniref:Uncharacterized protein n=1 Tax=Carnegiea gigantea TaxID=171969 RepID=A0A9Q1L071_9CARY|nr:LOW QUALITY PROTEIN: hypothetical protein Cgig2_005089 [Carnegiea gigantea]
MIKGAIPHYFVKMNSLAHLDLCLNYLIRFEGNMSPLSYLNLAYNQPYYTSQSTGHFLQTIREWVPEAIGSLCSLQTLSLSNNYTLSCDVSCIIETFSGYAYQSLMHLDLDLAVSISATWAPPFQLYDIHLSGCKVGPPFPHWLATQMNFSELDTSNARILDTFPPYWLALLI